MGTKEEKKEPTPLKNNVKPYGKVLLTLKNQLLPEEKLANTPSQNDGLSMDAETDLRIHGCEQIQTAGILLKLPQVAMATGQVLLQRFYYSKSLVRHPVEHTAMACVCLASKIEEAPRRVRDVVNVFTHIRQVNSGNPIHPVVLDENYIHLKNMVIKAERRVLKELGFCVHIKHPHKIIVMYLQVLGFQNNQKLMQYSWNYMNDSLRTDVFVRYQPETVACACIYLTSRKLKIPLPKSPHWYTIFGASEPEIRDICIRILKLYNRPKVGIFEPFLGEQPVITGPVLQSNIEDLEQQVEKLCEKYKSNLRAKTKGASGAVSPNNNSQEHQKTSAHNAWGGFISRSGSHMPPPVNDKRSRSRSETRSPDRRHHKKLSKKHRSRTRSPKNHKKDRKRKSYSRSRSNTPHKQRKTRDRKRSRSHSNEREGKNDRYIDRYEDKYDRERKYKDDRDGKHKEDRERYDERKERNSKKYERDEKYREREDNYKEREEKYGTREERYSAKAEKRSKKAKHRDRSESRSKDKRRRS
ncbi:hypothetical protein D910_05298 [Dendroctonus ponderosae]|uniref:Cyclin-like domain-containing protein n=1 Tax=Dendroctonus ponderosae TaxID=77166 RepID=U4UDB7_DENPD|nr:hypothetical protein D910_05298 [Dendroctonus ponderosae]